MFPAITISGAARKDFPQIFERMACAGLPKKQPAMTNNGLPSCKIVS
jgi:hypothetical protein